MHERYPLAKRKELENIYKEIERENKLVRGLVSGFRLSLWAITIFSQAKDIVGKTPKIKQSESDCFRYPARLENKLDALADGIRDSAIIHNTSDKTQT